MAPPVLVTPISRDGGPGRDHTSQGSGAGAIELMLILGVNALHADASAALFADGELLAAAEEERFTRVKHASGLPVQALKWVLKEAEVSPSQVDHVAFPRNPHV